MDKKRPVNLDLGTIKFPVTSLVSITHRISGVILFFAVGIFLWMLESSLASEQSFNDLGQLLSHPICQFILWGSLAALAYHAIAGIRHLIMDFGVGEDNFSSGRNSAWAAVVVAVVAIVLITGWILSW